MTERDEIRGEAGLAAALAATRRSFDGHSEQARDTERRIVAATRGPTRMRKAFWLAPLAAAFVVSGALASELGGRLVELGQSWFAEGVPATTAPAPKRAAPVLAPSLPATATSDSPAPAEPAPEAAEPASAPTIVRAEPRAATRSRPVPTASAAKVEVAEAVDQLAVYKQAHHAHFAARDFAAALAGWDRYLAVAPNGTFALEARFNRAVALHRLGRRAEALEALRPFAEGAYGRYRRDEAKTLIDELR